MQKAIDVLGGWVEQAGSSDLKSWRANPSKDWAGTLVLTGKK